MPSDLRLRFAALMILAGAMSGCVPVTPAVVSSEKDRLVSAGYRVTSHSAAGYALAYSGAPPREIVCRRGRGGALRPLPESTSVGNTQVRYRSDIRVTVTAQPGKGGTETAQRDAFYVLTEVRTPAGRKRATLETISFASGGQARFRSGLTCLAG